MFPDCYTCKHCRVQEQYLAVIRNQHLNFAWCRKAHFEVGDVSVGVLFKLFIDVQPATRFFDRVKIVRNV